MPSSKYSRWGYGQDEKGRPVKLTKKQFEELPKYKKKAYEKRLTKAFESLNHNKKIIDKAAAFALMVGALGQALIEAGKPVVIELTIKIIEDYVEEMKKLHGE